MALSLFTDGLFADPYLTGLERELSRAFGPFLGARQQQQQQQQQQGGGGGTLSLPRMHPMDIVEKPDRYSIVADAPGMAPDDVRIEFLNGNLVVSGEKKGGGEKTEDRAGVRVHRSERTFSSFSRSFTLPEDAKEEGIAATLTNGVLTVDVPKAAKPAKQEPKRIKVNAA